MMMDLKFNLFGKTLNRREQMALSIAAVVIVLFLILQIVVFPLIDKRSRMRKAIVAKKAAVEEIASMKVEYDSLNRKSRMSAMSVKKRKADFTLFLSVLFYRQKPWRLDKIVNSEW